MYRIAFLALASTSYPIIDWFSLLRSVSSVSGEVEKPIYERRVK
jgi:hypothetical protein